MNVGTLMKVGTLVKVCEAWVYFDGNRWGSDEEMFGYVIETCAKDEAIRLLLKWEMRMAIAPMFENLGLVMTNKRIHNEDGLLLQLSEWLGHIQHNKHTIDETPNFYKVMLANGSSGWVAEYWPEEV